MRRVLGKLVSETLRFPQRFPSDAAPRTTPPRPRHAWTSGMVALQRNDAHELQGGDPMPLNSMLELPAVIEKLLIRDKVKLHASDRMRRYHQLAPKGKAG